jgi:hypothetical protein
LSTAALALAAWVLPRNRRALAILPIITFFELASQNLAHLPMAPRALLQGPEPFSQTVLNASAKPEGPLPRVISAAMGHAPRTMSGGDLRWVEVFRRMLRSAESGTYGISSLTFNFPLTSRRAQRLFVRNSSLRDGLAPFFGFCFRTLDSRTRVPEGDRVLIDDTDHELRLTQTPCAPRAYLAAAHTVTSEHDAVQAFSSVLSLPPRAAVWENGPELPGGEGSLDWREETPERLSFEVAAKSDSALVINDEWAPGWKATLDGQPTPIFVTNGDVRGVAVPVGEHRVQMTYHTPGLPTGAALSALGLLLIVGIALAPRLPRGPRGT